MISAKDNKYLNISTHISFEEATKSETAIRKGIKNIPNKEQLENMKLVADKCFEPIRLFFKVAIFINSFFRCIELNKIIGGSKTSEHCEGKAIDIDGKHLIKNSKIFFWALENLKFTQLIWEFGDNENPEWVHISYDKNNLKQEVLRAEKIGTKTIYTKFV